MTSIVAPRPIVRWAGSKARMVPILRARMPSNYGRYHEPFAGSACLFLSVNPRLASISDTNISLIEAYREIARAPEELHERIASLPLSREAYYRIRALDVRDMSRPERAAHFLYLNRYCFNGIYRTNREGKFNVPYGSRLGTLPSVEAFKIVATRLRRTRIRAQDFESAATNAAPGDFVYLDPPYFAADRPTYGEYGYNTYRDGDLDRLCATLSDLNHRSVQVMLSYREEIKLVDHLRGWRTSSFIVHRGVAASPNARTKSSEILATNY